MSAINRKRSRDENVPTEAAPHASSKKPSVQKKQAPTNEKHRDVAACPLSSTSDVVIPAAKVAAEVPSKKSLQNALVVVGTYHSVMAGLALKQNKFFLKFSVKHHVGCVNHVAICDKYFASAGTDERIFLFTAKDRGGQVADLGSLAPASEAKVLVWQGTQFLVCGCADGTIAVYRSRDWESVLAVQVHEKSVHGLALHPSGNLAVSVGGDRQVAALDMQSGKLITRTKIPQDPLAVHFSTDGAVFVVLTQYELLFFDTQTVQKIASVSVEKQPRYEIHCVTFVGPKSVVFGMENGSLGYVADYEVPQFKEVTFRGVPDEIIKAQEKIVDETKKKHPTRHATRVKALLFLEGTLMSADANGALIASTVCEDGQFLDFRCSANCQGRITSVGALSR